MENTRKKIGVYQTGEYGAVLFENNLHKALLRTQLDKEFDIVHVEPKDIMNDDFMNNLAGIAMPGRNSGQQYRDEWAEKGYTNIKTAVTHHGMDILAVCAASAVLCKEVSWFNRFQANGNKSVTNENALFDGCAVGSFDNLWQDGYRSVMTQPDAYHSNVLAAKILPVHYARALSGKTHGTDGHGLYWGGCVFAHDSATDMKQRIEVLARHQNVVTTPLINENNPVSINKVVHSPFINPAAVLEFTQGKGRVIFSNIHPEIDSETFEMLFQSTPQAKADRDAFAADKNKIVQADGFSAMIFDRFVTNCAAIGRKSDKAVKKQVAEPVLSG